MKKITKILGIFSLALALCALLCIAASASLTDFSTAYGDITPENGYVHIGVHNNAEGKAAATDSDGDGKVEQYLTKGFNAYFNETTETLVFIATGSYTGDSGDWNQTSVKNTPGQIYYLAYWANVSGLGNAARIKHLELRGGTHLSNISYAITVLTSVRDIKIDSSITDISGQKVDTGVFRGMTSLVTVGHGSFSKEDGSFTPTTYKDGVADLTGFKSMSPGGNISFPNGVMLSGYMVNGTSIKKLILPTSLSARSGATYYKCAYVDGTLYYVLDSAGSANFSSSAFQLDGVWYSSNSNDAKYSVKVNAQEDIYGGEYSGIIALSIAQECASLSEVTFGAPVLRSIEKGAFLDCKQLTVLEITGEVSSDITIASDAFSGVTSLTVRVRTGEDAERFGAALAAAGIKNVALSIKDMSSVSGLSNPLAAEGFSIRTSGYNGLRGLFSFDDSVMARNEENGFSLVEYGVVAATGTVYDRCGSAEGVFGRVKEQHIVQIPIYCADGTGVNRYVDFSTKTFCVTITHIAEANYKSEIYMMSYAVMEKNGVRYRLFCEYEYEKNGAKKNTISLFDTALGLYNEGVVTPSNCPEFSSVIAPVLKYGGVTLALPARAKEYL